MIDKRHDLTYLTTLLNVLNNGVKKPDRTGTGTRSIFGVQMRFDLSNNSIPLLTSKKVFHKGIIHELLWMISGSTNIQYLKDNRRTIFCQVFSQ